MIERLKSLPKERIVDLNVIPELDAGRDPFNLIIKTLGGMKEDPVLHLLINFEPVPLYTVMKMKGYDHMTEQHRACTCWCWAFGVATRIKKNKNYFFFPPGGGRKKNTACTSSQRASD